MSSIIEDIKSQYFSGGIIQKIIFWNIGSFLISLLFFYQFSIGAFNFPSWLALYSPPFGVLCKPWTLITYLFLHTDFWHLFFNMMVLSFSGNLFLTFFNQRQLLGVFLLGGIFSGIVFVLSYFFLGKIAPIVGASGAVMAILVATTAYSPLMNVRIFFVLDVKLWYVTGVIILLDFMQIGLSNSGGHIAHLAGASFGVLYILLLKEGMDLSLIISKIVDFFQGLFTKNQQPKLKKVYQKYDLPQENNKSKVILKSKKQQQIDDILDKISKSGYDSLTEEEKEFLFKAGNEN